MEEPVNSVSAQVGIDVSKAELVVSIDQGKPYGLPNTKLGIDKLIAELPSGSQIHLEASGGYERLAYAALRKAGLVVHRHNAFQTRRLAQGLGVKAKTDPVDARVLAASGHLLKCYEAKSQEREHLSDLSRAISAIQDVCTAFRQRLDAPALDAPTARELRQLINSLQKRIARLEVKFVQRVAASSFKNQYDLILSVPGVGPKTARICLCELPENLPEQRPAQIASYAGVAPINDDSGKRTGSAHVGPGNSRLKAALYMPALGSVKRQTWAKEVYARLRAKGRIHQVAIVAVMRRLLMRIVAVLRRGSAWQDMPPAP